MSSERDYHEEGLETRGNPRERHAFANALAQAIQQAQGTVDDLVVKDMVDYYMQIYHPVFALVRAATIVAWERRDRHWREDAIATIEFVGLKHASHPQWLLPQLEAEVQRMWEWLARPQGVRAGFWGKVRGLFSRT